MWYGTLKPSEQQELAALLYRHFLRRWMDDPLLNGFVLDYYSLDPHQVCGIEVHSKNGQIIKYALFANDIYDALVF